MNYLQYELNGRIICTGTCPDDSDLSEMGLILTQEAPFSVDLSEDYIQDGIITRRLPSPSYCHEWDWSTKSWLPDFNKAREDQRQAWNNWRDSKFREGYLYNSHIFHSNETFMSELHMLLKGYERGYFTGTSAIRTKDNLILNFTHAEIETLLLVIGQYRQNIYSQSWIGKDALSSKTTLEEILAGGPPL
jgi:hypothetical protein